VINNVNQSEFKMASNALVTTRVNENIKLEASEVLASMGLTVSDAVRLMLTKIAKDKSLPFELWQPNVETIAAMEEDLAHAKSFTSVVDLMADLNADD
jgi:DNA-damage-inducible protein J